MSFILSRKYIIKGYVAQSKKMCVSLSLTDTIIIFHYMRGFRLYLIFRNGVLESAFRGDVDKKLNVPLCSVVAKKLGCRLKIKFRRLKEELNCPLCFPDSSPAKNPAGNLRFFSW